MQLISRIKCIRSINMGNHLNYNSCCSAKVKEVGQVNLYDETTDRSRIKDLSYIHPEIQVSNNVKNWNHSNIELKEENKKENKELLIVIFI